MTKAEWQRIDRLEFKNKNGYSTKSHYGTGGLRQEVLQRDRFQCIECGMSDSEHRKKWGRPITVDHKDRDRKNNTLENLQTLCLSCHGRKDILPKLRVQRVPVFKNQIINLRRSGGTYQNIADHFGFSIAIIHRWIKRWEIEGLL